MTIKEIEYGIEKFHLNCNLQNFEKIASKKYFSHSKRNEKFISYTNFLEFLMNKKKLINKDNLLKIFHLLDYEQKGILNCKSFIKYYERMGKKKTPEKIADIFHEIGLNKDDQISFETFYKCVTGNIFF